MYVKLLEIRALWRWAMGMMGEQKGKPMPVELHWIGYLLNSLGQICIPVLIIGVLWTWISVFFVQTKVNSPINPRQKWTFHWLTGSRGGEMHHRAKFRQNLSNHCGVIVIFPIFNFKMAAAASWIFKILHFYWQMRSGGRDASSCQISSNSVKLLWSYCEFSNFQFQNGRCHHLNFKILHFIGRCSPGSSCIIVQNFVKIS